MRYLNENKILLEEPEDNEVELDTIDIENQEDDVDSSEESTKSIDDVETTEETAKEVEHDDGISSGISSMLNSSIVSTWNRIDEFTSMIATIKSYDSYEDLVTIIQSILDDEMIHIGQLQKALSLVSSSEEFISQGVDKAEEIIDSSKSIETSDYSEFNDESEEVIENDENSQPESNTEEIEDTKEETKKENKEEVEESLVKRCKIKYSKGDDTNELQEMLRACNLKTTLKSDYILVEGKVKDIYNGSGMIDIPVHEEDLF